MSILNFDWVDGGYWENGSDFSRFIRKGIVTGITVSSTHDPFVMVRALSESTVPHIGDPHPGITGLKVRRQIVRGVAGDQCSVEVHYETPQFGGAAGTYFLKDSTGLQSEAIGVIAQTFDPIYVSYKPDSSTGTAKSYPALIQRLTPLRTLEMISISSARPDVSLLNCIGKVNDSIWQGLPAGYWLCSEVSSATENATFLYTVTANFTTRFWRDWKEYAYYISPMTGVAPADVIGTAGPGGNLAKIKTAITAAYTGPKQDQSANGFVAVSPYDVANFFLAFGI